MKTVRAHGLIHLIEVVVIGIIGFGVPIACLIIGINGLIGEDDLLMYISLIFCGVVILACGIFTILILLKRKIILYEDRVYIPHDVKKSNLLVRKIQHETTIRYDEIQSIYLSLRCTDSNNKPIANCVTPMINLVFVCSGGVEKVANLHPYSENQIIFLLDYICERVKKTSGKILTEMTGKELFESFEKSENKKHKL